MKANGKQKLCWNCEGRVALELENCPYCAVYLGPAPEDDEAEDPIAPPYRLVDAPGDQVPASPYASQEEKREEQEEGEIAATSSDIKQLIFPMGFLSAGALFALFGFVLLLFSHDGVLTLTWNGNLWYAYLLLALPLLFFGWRSLAKSSET